MECEEQLLLALSLPLPCCGACVSLPALEPANHPSGDAGLDGEQPGPPGCDELTAPRDGRGGSPWQCSDTPESCKSCRTRCWLALSLSLRDSVLCRAMPGEAAPVQGPGGTTAERSGQREALPSWSCLSLFAVPRCPLLSQPARHKAACACSGVLPGQEALVAFPHT